MSQTLFRSRRAERLLMLVVLIGVTSFAWARVRTADTRTLPYQGVLERDGAPVSGPVTARFGLFDAPNANTACVATNSCALWSDEYDVDVVDGRFSVLLGEGDEPLTTAILSSSQLFLGVAFKTADDASFTALAGTQEIIGAAVLQPGAVTGTSLARGTFFTADINFDSGIPAQYVVSSSPPGWIGVGVHGPQLVTTTFPLNTGGATKLTCTATPRSEAAPIFVSLPTVTPTALGVSVVRNGGGANSTDIDSISVICIGF
ncbi:MAG TPA: hypothetical protein VGF99_20275 [Myxococcota bacterium]